MTHPILWILVAAFLLLAVGSRAHSGSDRHRHDKGGILGGDCFYRSAEEKRADAERLRRRSERALDRLPLRRSTLGHIDQLVIHESVEIPVEHSIDRLEGRIREEEARDAEPRTGRSPKE